MVSGHLSSFEDHLKCSTCLLELKATFLWQWVGGLAVFSLFSLDSARNPKGFSFQGRQIVSLCRPQRIRRRKSPKAQGNSKIFKETRTTPLLFILLSHSRTINLFSILDCFTLYQHVVEILTKVFIKTEGAPRGKHSLESPSGG